MAALCHLNGAKAGHLCSLRRLVFPPTGVRKERLQSEAKAAENSPAKTWAFNVRSAVIPAYAMRVGVTRIPSRYVVRLMPFGDPIPRMGAFHACSSVKLATARGFFLTFWVHRCNVADE